MCETHLVQDESISIYNYSWYGFNRKGIHVRAKRGSGGVGILVKNSLIDQYFVVIIDQTVDGILGIKFRNKFNNYEFIVFVCYLPPESSIWGRNSDAFFSHLLSLIFLYSETQCILLAGDFNARIGDLEDFIEEIDKIPKKTCIDKVKNSHGNALIDYLKDSKMCVLNGRLNKEGDNFTSVTKKGSSVVDYIIVSHAALKFCNTFKIDQVTDIISNYNLHNFLSSKCKAPDHAILTVILDFKIINMNTKPLNSTVHQLEHVGIVKKKIYDLKHISDQFMNNEIWRQSSENLCDFLHSNSEAVNIDHIYDLLCSNVLREMEDYIPHHEISLHKTKNRCIKNSLKPYWDTELKSLWEYMKVMEKQFRQSKRNGSKIHILAARQCFIYARNEFYRLLRNKERRYNRDRILKIESLSKGNPREFWKTVKALGPQKKCEVPKEVRVEGKLIGEGSVVKASWKEQFQSLYRGPPENNTFNCNFYFEMLNRMNIKLAWMKTLNYESNEFLNSKICFSEVEKVISNLKKNKAPGIDLIPNEILKFKAFHVLLYRLFSYCFESGNVPKIWRKSVISPIPKGGDRDPFEPLSYRGISLISCICKAFSLLINNRIVSYCEMLDIIHDEQNGFRSGRSCVDHLFVINSIIKNRLNNSCCTYAAFVDMEKAYDFTERNLLFYRLLEINVDGKIFNIIKSLYTDTSACVNYRGTEKTDWFPVPSGVRQGTRFLQPCSQYI